MISVYIHEFLMLLYTATFYFRYLTDFQEIVTFLLWIGSSFALFAYMYCVSPKERKLIAVLAIVDIIAFIGLAINGGHTIVNVFMLPAEQAMGIALYKSRDQLKKTAGVFLSIFAMICVASFLIPKVTIFWDEVIVISKLVSSNSISIVLLQCLGIDLIYRLRSNKRPWYFLYVVALIVAVHCDGKGGILATAFLFTGMLLIEWKQNLLSWKRIACFSTVGLLAVLVSGYGQNLLAYVTSDNSRFYLWSNYLNLSIQSVKDFVFGANVSSVDFLVDQKNAHNTFLNWHYYYGLLPFVFFTGITVKSVVNYIRKKNHVMLILLGTMFVRMMTDETSYAFMPLLTYMWFDSFNAEDNLMLDFDGAIAFIQGTWLYKPYLVCMGLLHRLAEILDCAKTKLAKLYASWKKAFLSLFKKRSDK